MNSETMSLRMVFSRFVLVGVLVRERLRSPRPHGFIPYRIVERDSVKSTVRRADDAERARSAAGGVCADGVRAEPDAHRLLQRALGLGLRAKLMLLEPL